MSKKQILDELPRLSVADLTEIRNKTEALLALQSGISTNVSQDADLFYEALVAVLPKGSCPPKAQLIKAHKKALTEAQDAADGYIDRAVKSEDIVITRGRRLAAYKFILGILCNSIVEFNQYPLTAKTLLNYAPFLHGAMERAFPGYRNSGLIKTVFRRVFGIDG